MQVVLTAVGMIGELWASTDYGRAGHITSMGDIQVSLIQNDAHNTVGPIL